MVDFTWYQYLAIFSVVFIGELYGSVVGGGALLIQPALILIGIPAHVAVANDVSAATGTSLGSFLVYRKKKLIRWNVVGLMLPGLLVGAVVGLLLFQLAPASVLEKVIGIAALVFLAYGLRSKSSLGLEGKPLPINPRIKLSLFGLVIGAYTTFSGAGGGTVSIYALTTLFGATFLQALGILSVAYLAVMTVGFLGYLYLGLIHFDLLLVMFTAALLAGSTGARIAVKIGDKWLRFVFSIAVLGFAVYLLLK